MPYEPQTNGCIERFWRTLKEQCIRGRTFETLAEIETAVRRFIEDYNRHWRIERLGFKTRSKPANSMSTRSLKQPRHDLLPCPGNWGRNTPSN